MDFKRFKRVQYVPALARVASFSHLCSCSLRICRAVARAFKDAVMPDCFFFLSFLTISVCQLVPGIQDLDCCGADRDGSAANLAHRFDLPDDAQARPMKGLKKGGFLSKTTLTGFFFCLIRFYCSHNRLFKSICS